MERSRSQTAGRAGEEGSHERDRHLVLAEPLQHRVILQSLSGWREPPHRDGICQWLVTDYIAL